VKSWKHRQLCMASAPGSIQGMWRLCAPGPSIVSGQSSGPRPSQVRMGDPLLLKNSHCWGPRQKAGVECGRLMPCTYVQPHILKLLQAQPFPPDALSETAAPLNGASQHPGCLRYPEHVTWGPTCLTPHNPKFPGTECLGRG
jgi:hypothetical protein